MKFGIRKFSVKKRVSARTFGKATRAIKKSTNPFYGAKGIGWVKSPKRAAYNKIYSQITFDVFKIIGEIFKLFKW